MKNINKIKIIAIIVLIGFTIAACASAPQPIVQTTPQPEQTQQLPRITIINNTGYPVYEMYMSSSDDDFWGSDWLNDEILSSGRAIVITLKVPLSTDSVYDIMLVDTDDDTYTKMNVRITENAIIEFVFDDIDW